MSEGFIPSHNQAELVTLHAIALVCISMSIIGSLLVIAYTIHKGQYQTICERFPLYVSILNFMWSVSHSVDHGLMIVNGGKSPSRGVCVGFAAVIGALRARVCVVNAGVQFILTFSVRTFIGAL
ncbi:hypothetical protein HDU97_005259 [Phlyctochytrium planicorne]|nr:hypothetical protein HDU97_005259 [Phlyctochytrium planicorne]